MKKELSGETEDDPKLKPEALPNERGCDCFFKGREVVDPKLKGLPVPKVGGGDAKLKVGCVGNKEAKVKPLPLLLPPPKCRSSGRKVVSPAEEKDGVLKLNPRLWPAE